METGSGFRICGYVVRRNVVPSGKCAFLVLDVPGENGRSSKIDLKTFDAVEEVGALVVGGKAEVTGRVVMEKVTNRARVPVMVDGRAKWVASLTIKTVKVDEASIPAKKTPAVTDDPFDGPEGW